jgi:nucleotide-binding universal stress UspA family protein
MSRDSLAPPSLAAVSDRLGTPVNSITLTGAVLLALIAFVPILDIAKLASAFQIMVFSLINLALIAFREGTAEYEPEFTSPLYPWMQAFGAIAGVGLLTQMGDTALAGAGAITVASVLWYAGYVRPRVDREGAATGAIRRQVSEGSLSAVAAADATHETLVALTKQMDERRVETLISLAADLVRDDDGRVVVVRFEEVPDQAPLTPDTATQSAADRSFERRIERLGEELAVDIEADEIVSHDTKHAIVNVAERRGVDAIVAEHEPLRLRSRLIGDPIDWVVRHAPCDVLLVDSSDPRPTEEVVVAGETAPFPSAAVNVAELVASAHDGRVSLWYPAEGSDDRHVSVSEYHAELSAMVDVPVEIDPIPADQRPPKTDLLVHRGADHRFRGALADRNRPFTGVAGTTVTVYPQESGRPPLGRRLLERFLL